MVPTPMYINCMPMEDDFLYIQYSIENNYHNIPGQRRCGGSGRQERSPPDQRHTLQGRSPCLT